MVQRYRVTADVNNDKIGQAKLVADLSQEDLLTYANLTDQEKLGFLKEHGARLEMDVNQVDDKDISNYMVNGAEVNLVQPKVKESRKMRMNINGKDTGWVDVTEENEAEYNKLMEQFNAMQEDFNKRFNDLFNHRWSNFFSSWKDKKFIDNKED